MIGDTKTSKWPWRDYLAADEAALIDMIDEAKANWRKLNKKRHAIKNRAVQRAMYDARRPVAEPSHR